MRRPDDGRVPDIVGPAIGTARSSGLTLYEDADELAADAVVSERTGFDASAA